MVSDQDLTPTTKTLLSQAAFQPVLEVSAELTELLDRMRQVRSEVEKIIVGQSRLIERVLIALLASGHLLIEGVPGLAKTRTVRTFSLVLGGSWQRIQFTPDLVPSDLIGTRVWLADEGRFDREIGPVATNFLLADEINRAPAKVQSALLQAMEERHVTIGRETIALPDPFLVLATQNPLESEGTYPLPDAQTDRFMFRVNVTYPAAADELEILRRHLVGEESPMTVLSPTDVLAARRICQQVYVSKEVAEKIVALVAATRDPGSFDKSLEGTVVAGAGPRGTLALCAAAQARALLHGRTEVTSTDIADLAIDTLAHRINLSYQAAIDDVSQTTVVQRALVALGLHG